MALPVNAVKRVVFYHLDSTLGSIEVNIFNLIIRITLLVFVSHAQDNNKRDEA